MKWMRLAVQPPKSGSGSRAEWFVGDRKFEALFVTALVDDGETGRVCSWPVNGPGDLRDMLCRLVLLLLVLLKAHKLGRRRRGPGTLFRGDAKWLQYSKYQYRHGR